jgi:hypothetical protein
MSVLEEIRGKYAKQETISDSYGRILVARRLTTSQCLAIREMATSADREVIGTLMVAASLLSVDGHPITFPKTRKELDVTLDMLDDPGVEALVEAFTKLAGEPEQETLDAAKNSPATPNSDIP